MGVEKTARAGQSYVVGAYVEGLGGSRVACFGERDISAVIATLAQANPGSARMFDMADAVYMFSIGSAITPTEFVRFSSSGIQIKSDVAVNINSPSLLHNGVNVGATHVHGGVTTGSGNSAVPH